MKKSTLTNSKPADLETRIWALWPYARATVKRYTTRKFPGNPSHNNRSIGVFSADDRDYAALDALIDAVEAARAGRIQAPRGETSLRAWIATRAVRRCNRASRGLIEERVRRDPWLVAISEGDDAGEVKVGRDETLVAVNDVGGHSDPLARLLLTERLSLLEVPHGAGSAEAIVSLRRAGASYREIACQLGLSQGTVRKTLEKYRGAVRQRALEMGYAASRRILIVDALKAATRRESRKAGMQFRFVKMSGGWDSGWLLAPGENREDGPVTTIYPATPKRKIFFESGVF